MSERIHVRVARPQDTDAVESVLKTSYAALMASAYEPAILAKALPLMVRANADLLRSGTFYVAFMDGRRAVGCGGWTFARPGEPQAAIDPGLGHIRHFATDPNVTRRGVGRALFARCVEDAREAGVERFECYSSLAAVEFYKALGFLAIESITVAMGQDIAFPSVRMEAAI